jgi:hypothetical protein
MIEGVASLFGASTQGRAPPSDRKRRAILISKSMRWNFRIGAAGRESLRMI